MKVCSIYDVKADSFAAPFFVRTEGEAIRMFSDVINKPSEENLWYKHPHDFVLFCLGDWNEVTGKFTLLDSEEKLIAGGEAVIEPKLKAVQ